MGSRKIENNQIGEYPYLGEVETLNLLKVGVMNLEFENMNNHLAPRIKAGSFIEANNVLYQFHADEEIQGEVRNGTVYIKTQTDVNGDLFLVYDFASELPDYNRLKKGYYDGQDRFIGSLIYKDGIYHRKIFFNDPHIRAVGSSNDIIINGEEYTPFTSCYSDYYEAFYYGCIKDGNGYVIKTLDNIRYEIVQEISGEYEYFRARLGSSVSSAIFFEFDDRISGNTHYRRYVSNDGETFHYASGLDETTPSTPQRPFDYYNGYFVIVAGAKIFYSIDLITWTLSQTFSHNLNGIYHCGSNFVTNYNYTNDYVYYSSDLSSWALCSVNNSSIYYVYIFQISDDKLAMGSESEYLTSTDGITFSVKVAGFPSNGQIENIIEFKSNVYMHLYYGLYKLNEEAGTYEIILDDTYLLKKISANSFFLFTLGSSEGALITIDGIEWIQPNGGGSHTNVSHGIDTVSSINSYQSLGLIDIKERLF